MKPKLIWFEIPAKNIDRAQTFYEQLFDVVLQRCDCGDEVMAFFPEERGAISQCDGFEPAGDGVVAYFSADGMLQTMLARALRSGGAVLRDATPIAGGKKGVFALLSDTEGNRIGLHAPSSR